jgi:hypothetical protein
VACLLILPGIASNRKSASKIGICFLNLIDSEPILKISQSPDKAEFCGAKPTSKQAKVGCRASPTQARHQPSLVSVWQTNFFIVAKWRLLMFFLYGKSGTFHFALTIDLLN